MVSVFIALLAKLSHVTGASCDPVAGKGLTRRGRAEEGRKEGVRKSESETERSSREAERAKRDGCIALEVRDVTCVILREGREGKRTSNGKRASHSADI